jgi:hypothetical protein
MTTRICRSTSRAFCMPRNARWERVSGRLTCVPLMVAHFSGQRSSISSMSLSAQRTASLIAETVAGTRLEGSEESLRAPRIAAVTSSTRLRPSSTEGSLAVSLFILYQIMTFLYITGVVCRASTRDGALFALFRHCEHHCIRGRLRHVVSKMGNLHLQHRRRGVYQQCCGNYRSDMRGIRVLNR